jgi:hypothetical protein
MAKRKTRVQKRKLRKSNKRTRTFRKMRGGNYRDATYDGFKNKGKATVFFPGGSSTWDELVTAGEYPGYDNA